jgi:hypothetical protein
LQCLHKIVPQRRVNGLRILLALELGLVEPDQFLPFSGILAEAVIGDAIEPGRKFRLSAKAAQVLVSAQKSLLREIIGQTHVTSRELAQEPADGGLVVANQLSEGVVIIVNKDPRNEIGII